MDGWMGGGRRCRYMLRLWGWLHESHVRPHSFRAVHCDKTLPPPPRRLPLSLSPLGVPPSLPVQWQLCCPQRDDWESVALPLQSYRSTAAGVSSSALPLRSLSLTEPPLSSRACLRRGAAATHWRLWEVVAQSFSTNVNDDDSFYLLEPFRTPKVTLHDEHGNIQLKNYI